MGNGIDKSAQMAKLNKFIQSISPARTKFDCTEGTDRWALRLGYNFFITTRVWRGTCRRVQGFSDLLLTSAGFLVTWYSLWIRSKLWCVLYTMIIIWHNLLVMEADKNQLGCLYNRYLWIKTPWFWLLPHWSAQSEQKWTENAIKSLIEQEIIRIQKLHCLQYWAISLIVFNHSEEGYCSS